MKHHLVLNIFYFDIYIIIVIIIILKFNITLIAPYFENCISADDLDELNIEIIRNALYKAYLEDFYKYCKRELGGTTGQIMSEILEAR